MDLIRFEIPFPPSELFPNRANGKHWSSTRKAKDGYRDAAYWLAVEARKAYPMPVHDLPLTLTFCPPNRINRDRDNCLAATKHALDGIAKALGVDDLVFEPLTIQRGAVRKGGCVIVEVQL